MNVWRFNCEWDIGCNDGLWATEQLLLRDVAECLESCGIEEPIDELVSAGLLHVESESVIHE